MSAKLAGTSTFLETATIRHDDPPTAARLEPRPEPAKQNDEQREMVAVLAALSLLNKTKLLERVDAYMVGKLKGRLRDFNRQTNSWRRK